MGYGKYATLTVGQVLDIHKKGYLVYLYYHCEAITFTPEILDELKILPEDRINKPGVDYEGYLKWEKRVNRGGGLTHLLYNRLSKKNLRAVIKASVMRNNLKYSRKNLQAYNQGKKKYI